MKYSFICNRVDSAGKHNDRNYNKEQDGHLYQDAAEPNRYWNYVSAEGVSFRDLELSYYDQYFSDYIDRQNEKKIANRNPGRCQTVEDYHKAKNSRPEDVIIQIGDMYEHISGNELWSIGLDYIDEFEQRFDSNCRILDMALHMDEETPHIHIRRVWFGEDEDGYDKVSQNLALEKLGIERPYPDKPKGPKNNPKITMSRIEEALFEKTAKSHGIVLEEHEHTRQVHYSVEEFKQRKAFEHEVEFAESIVKDPLFEHMIDEENWRIYNDEKNKRKKFEMLKSFVQIIKAKIDAIKEFLEAYKDEFVEFEKNGKIRVKHDHDDHDDHDGH